MRQMKDSGIAWIGKIPQEWKVRQVKRNYKCIAGSGFPIEAQGKDGEELQIYKAGDISKAGKYIDKSSNTLSFSEANEMGFEFIPVGCILMPKIGEAMKKNSRAISTCCCAVDNNCQALIPFNADSLFSYYLFLCVDMKWFDNAGTIPCVNNEKLLSSYIVFPPLPEQQAIADKLDKVCGEIDKVIAKTKTAVEEYKKLKQAIITEAVTGKKIKDEREKRKDKVEWAEIKLKWVATLNGRIGWQGLTSIEYCDEGAYLITGINFENGGVNWNTCVHVPLERWEEAKDIQISEGDLIITKDGTVGKTAIVRNMPGKTSLNSGVLLISTNDNCKKEYLYWVLNSDIFWKWFNDINSGNSTIIHLYQHDFKEFSFPLHPLPEQQAIVAYLDSKCGAIDEVIAKKQQLITEMENYKKSVIYEYVTGKKEVG